MLLFFMGNPTEKMTTDYYMKYSSSFAKKKPNLLICDARSKVAALGNKLLGKGWENSNFYTNIQLTFHSIANLDQVKHSFHLINQKRKGN